MTATMARCHLSRDFSCLRRHSGAPESITGAPYALRYPRTAESCSASKFLLYSTRLIDFIWTQDRALCAAAQSTHPHRLKREKAMEPNSEMRREAARDFRSALARVSPRHGTASGTRVPRAFRVRQKVTKWMHRVRVLRLAAASWRQQAQRIGPVLLCSFGAWLVAESPMRDVSCDFDVQPAPDGRGFCGR